MRQYVLLSCLFALLSCSKSVHAYTMQDSSYHNWYYDSREKLYQRLKSNHYDIIFFGNSITERGPWDELIGIQYKVGNRGIGGDNTYGMKARIQDVVRQRPKKIFLMMGINDIGRGISVERIIENYQAIIKQIKQVSPKTKIYLQSVLPLNDRLLTNKNLIGKSSQIRLLNEQISSLANQHMINYVDIASVLGENDVLKEQYTSDGIHVNTRAYIDWVRYLKKNNYL